MQEAAKQVENWTDSSRTTESTSLPSFGGIPRIARSSNKDSTANLGFEAKLWLAADTFRRDLHPDFRADYVIANPPFNDSDWFRKHDDVRWQFGVLPKGNANFAWVQHYHPPPRAPRHGKLGN